MMVQKSGEKTVYPIMYDGIILHPRWLIGISEPSTVSRMKIIIHHSVGWLSVNFIAGKEDGGPTRLLKEYS